MTPAEARWRGFESAAGGVLREPTFDSAASLSLISELSGRLVLQRELHEAASLCVHTLLRALPADRAYCRLLETDGRSSRLWAAAGTGSPAPEETHAADGGLTGEVLGGRVTQAVPADRSEGRLEHPVDDPAGAGPVHWAGAPIPGVGARPLGVLTAVRAADAPPFEEEELARLRLVAHLAAPALAVLAEERCEDQLLFREQRERGRPVHLFRRKALEHHASASWKQGDPLELAAPWQEWAFWSLLAVLVVLAGALLVIERPVRVAATAIVLASPPATGGGEIRVRAAAPLHGGRIEPGAAARIAVTEPKPPVPLTIGAVGATVATPAEATKRLGRPGAGILGAGPFQVVEAAGRWPEDLEPPPPGSTVTLEVVTGRESLIFSLFPALRQIGAGDR